MAGSPWADFNSFMSRSVSHISLMSHSVMPAAIAVPKTGATFAGSDDALRLAVLVMRGVIRSDTRFATAACWVCCLVSAACSELTLAWRASKSP